MATDLLARLKQSPVLCDGAMGTLLYAKGIFINRCYDELNVSQPDLIRDLHHEYLQAGAEIIETNTFGANSFRLARHGMENRVHEINLAGARLAREAAKSFDVWVAGSVGPMGVRIEPLGKTSFDEARRPSASKSQPWSKVESTSSCWKRSAISRSFTRRFWRPATWIRRFQWWPRSPLTKTETASTDRLRRALRRGLKAGAPTSSAATAASARWRCWTSWSVCGQLTSLPLAAQPNAGIPRSVEGRNIYLCSPEYMASYARKFVAAGVRLVGGCCGTTPEHIKVMKSALRVGEARAKAAPAKTKGEAAVAAAPAVPLEKRSKVGAKIASGEFVTMVEIVPPKGTDIRKEIEGARFLKSVGVDAINIPDSPRASARMSNQALSLLVQQEVGIEAILHYTCRDRNVLCIQSDLAGRRGPGPAQSDLHHRRSPEDGQLSRCDRRV